MYHLFRRKKVVLINFVFGFCTFCILGFILCVIFWIIKQNPDKRIVLGVPNKISFLVFAISCIAMLFLKV